MRPKFWKVSHGTEFFTYEQVLDALNERLVYVHMETRAKASSKKTQAQDFIEAPLGDYFYLTHGNEGVYVLGQFTGAANIFCKMGDGWLDRPYRPIKSPISRSSYNGDHMWWAPKDNSTFIAVPDGKLSLFEKHILKPYFGIELAKFGIK